MARVPTISTQSVTLNPISGQKQRSDFATPDAFGAGIFRAQGEQAATIGKFAEEADRIAAKMQTDYDTILVKERDNEASLRIEELMWGVDGNGGYMSLRGKEAVEASTQLKDEIDQIRGDALSGLSPDQAARLTGQINSRIETTRGQVNRQARGEWRRYEETVREGRLGAAVNSYNRAITLKDPEAAEQALDIVRGESLEEIRAKGLDPKSEEGRAIVRKNLTAAISVGVESAIKLQDFPTASKTLLENKEAIDAAVYAKLANELFKSVSIVEAQTIADQAYALHPTDERAAINFIKKYSSGEVREKALSSLLGDLASVYRVTAHARASNAEARANFNFKRQQENDARAVASRDAAEFGLLNVMAGKRIDDGFKFEQLNALTSGDRARLNNIRDDIAKGNRPDVTNRGGFGYVDKFFSKSQKEKAAVSLLEARDLLGNREYAVVETEIKAARKHEQAGTKSPFTAQQVMAARLERLNLSSRKDDDRVMVGMIKSLYQTAINAEVQTRKQNGQSTNLSYEDYKKIAIDVTDSRLLKEEFQTFWQKNNPFGTPKEQSAASIAIGDAEKINKGRKAFVDTYGRQPTTELEFLLFMQVGAKKP